MTNVADKIEEHRYLTPEEVQVARARIWRRQKLSLACAVGACAIALLVHSRGAPVSFGYIPFEESVLWLATVVAAIWFIQVSLSARDFDPASGKELEALRPMLDGDPVIRAKVREWAQARPLQARDTRFLLWLLPQWQQAQRAAEFARSLEPEQPGREQ